MRWFEETDSYMLATPFPLLRGSEPNKKVI